MQIIRNARELQEAAARLGRRSGLGGVLVPTMGALHHGHATLISTGQRLAAAQNRPAGCIVSIFVNPTQFNDPADLARYPRTLDADLQLCGAAGASMIFVPEVETMYPSAPALAAPVPQLPRVATEPQLEDAHRPGHFAGVCQVVQRLFSLLEPEAAVFGEKDWQQLQVIRAMAAGQPIQIISSPTVRDADGLAMSSRNRFLTPDQRTAAIAIPRALEASRHEPAPREAEHRMRHLLVEAGLAIEYAVVRDAETLGPLTGQQPGRALIAARAGQTRLIDNRPWP